MRSALGKKPPRPWPQRAPRRLTLHALTRSVQARLRQRDIVIHNLLTREIVRLVADSLTERFRKERELFFDVWIAGKYRRTDEQDRRKTMILKRRYNRSWFDTPTVKIMWRVAARSGPKRKRRDRVTKWDMVRVDHLTGGELAALQELHDEMKRLGDEDACTAIDKAMKYLRPPQ